jgi:LPXTG-site transpeptidase (sortase) family protein
MFHLKIKKTRLRLSRVLILAGALTVSAVLVFEACRYPWATVFGGSQGDSALPDPPPIVWENGDAGASAPSGGTSSAPAASSEPSVLPGNEASPAARPERYTELGVIKIPRLGVSQHILEGTLRQLHYGVGHVTGTALPGAAGNCVLAGHNTTSFRYLSRLSAGDSVILKDGGKEYTYSVFDSFVVLPTELSVLKNVPHETAVLTLITCTPYLTGTHRLIVRARLNGAPTPGYEAAPGLASSGSGGTAKAP